MRSIKKKMLIFEASRWVGIKEIGRDNKGQMIEIFQKAVDGKAVGEAWCLSFMQYCILATDALYAFAGLGSSPPSNLFRTEHCLTLWNKTPISQRLTVPCEGDLVVWQHYKNGVATLQGHVGLITHVISTKQIRTIEGNTSSDSEVNRDGDGVFDKVRSTEGSATMKIVGYISVWP